MTSFLDYINKSELWKGWKASGALVTILGGIAAYCQYEAQILPPGSVAAFVFGVLSIVIPKSLSEVRSLNTGILPPTSKS